jgi:hypothetical protein
MKKQKIDKCKNERKEIIRKTQNKYKQKFIK